MSTSILHYLEGQGFEVGVLASGFDRDSVFFRFTTPEMRAQAPDGGAAIERRMALLSGATVVHSPAGMVTELEDFGPDEGLIAVGATSEALEASEM